MKSLLNSAWKIFQGYLLHAMLAGIAALVAHFGWHVSVPVIPVSVASFTGWTTLNLFLSDIAKAWHAGRLQAELEHRAKQDIMGVVNSLLSDRAGNHGNDSPAAPPAAAPKAA